MPPSLVPRPNQRPPVRFTGSFTPKQQADVLAATDLILRGKGDFARQIGERLELTEVSAHERPEDGKTHAEVVFEIDMAEGACSRPASTSDVSVSLVSAFISSRRRVDMLNVGANLHGGCTMFMIDVCSSVTLLVLGVARRVNVAFVSQAITTVFHAPAAVGARLRIVNRTTSFGSRAVSARTEIWDTTNRRLVATGIHNKMTPPGPKL